ncbi:TPA: hypothetical protein N0F65_007094 [Lagenidium giganteum]|uniref:Uncharacterized protein n=1 Tax=Lagenidium giganteum TaxID=4803 RepID=A0AAV2YJI4_9STRA|nr:TPA: hypothetical protein N0F65_007094 [Lagenidium giganteum]
MDLVQANQVPQQVATYAIAEAHGHTVHLAPLTAPNCNPSRRFGGSQKQAGTTTGGGHPRSQACPRESYSGASSFSLDRLLQSCPAPGTAVPGHCSGPAEPDSDSSG